MSITQWIILKIDRISEHFDISSSFNKTKQFLNQIHTDNDHYEIDKGIIVMLTLQQVNNNYNYISK